MMVYKNINEVPLGLPGKLFRSPMPYARFDLDKTTFQEYLDANIDTVVMLVQNGEDLHFSRRDLKEEYSRNNISVIHYPIRDFDTPEDIERLKTTLQEVATHCQEGKNVVVHCFAGRGRTGLFIALLSRKVLGLGGQEAIDFTRKYFPAIETESQEKMVRDFKFNI
jgi:protein-tyrosine phosphatase